MILENCCQQSLSNHLCVKYRRSCICVSAVAFKCLSIGQFVVSLLSWCNEHFFQLVVLHCKYYFNRRAIVVFVWILMREFTTCGLIIVGSNFLLLALSGSEIIRNTFFNFICNVYTSGSVNFNVLKTIKK